MQAVSKSQKFHILSVDGWPKNILSTSAMFKQKLYDVNFAWRKNQAFKECCVTSR